MVEVVQLTSAAASIRWSFTSHGSSHNHLSFAAYASILITCLRATKDFVTSFISPHIAPS